MIFTMEIRGDLKPGLGVGVQSWQCDGERCAFLICDMWNSHWHPEAKNRTDILAPQIETAASSARRLGVCVVHAPSGTMTFYKNYPERQRIAQTPLLLNANATEMSAERCWQPVPIRGLRDPSDLGIPACPTRIYREHLSISVESHDVISDDKAEIVSFLKYRGTETIFFSGVHANMCILDNAFGIKNMLSEGFQCILFKDLTDSIFDPSQYPGLSQQSANEIIMQHVERFVCPTASSENLLRAAANGHAETHLSPPGVRTP